MTENNREGFEGNMNIALNAILEMIEAATASVRSQSEQCTNIHLECIPGSVSLNGHEYQQNVARQQGSTKRNWKGRKKSYV
jgi:DUF4097 and DUF4098 domain-containing protein YvlB